MIKGIGIDLVDIKRIKLDLARKILSSDEIHQFDNLSDIRKKEYLAGRFAIKEAYFKAGGNNTDFRKLSVINDESGKPNLNVEGSMISISHDGDYVVAVVILLG